METCPVVARSGVTVDSRAWLSIAVLPLTMFSYAALAQPVQLPTLDVQAAHPAPEAARLSEDVPAVRLPRAVFDQLPSERASDIVPRLPGVVVSGPPGEANSFGLRGLTPEYTRVQINGVQLPGAAQSRSFQLMNIPGFLLDEVAIIRNPDAATEADGIGGRISLRLRALPPTDATEVRAAFGGRDTLYDGQHFTASGLLARRFDDGFGVIGAVSLDRRQIEKVKDFSEYTFTGGPGGAGTIVDEREPKNNLNIDGFVQLGWQWDGGQLTLRPYVFDETLDNGRYRGTYRRLTQQLNAMTWGDGEERLTVGGIGGTLATTISPELRLEVDANIAIAHFESENTTIEQTPTGVFSSGAREASTIEDRQFDFAARLAWSPTWLAGHELRGGVQIRSLDRTSDGTVSTVDALGRVTQTAANITRSGIADYTARETYLATFVQDHMVFGRLILTPGLRLEHVQANLNGSLGQSTPAETDLMPSLPLVFRVTDNFSVRAAVSRQVNRPQLDQIAPGLTIRGPRSYYGNPELEPARAWAYDVGAEYATPEVFLSVNLFRRNITDVIEAEEYATNLFRYQNVGDGRVQGVELEQRINGALTGIDELTPLTFRFNQTFLDSRVDDPATGPRRFSEVPRFVGNFGVDWADPAMGTTIGLNATYTSTRQIRSYDGAGTQRYKEINPTTMLDFRAEQRVAPNFFVYFTAQNLLNQTRDEWESANWQTSRTAVIDTGRTFFLGVRITM
jgi:outer membrane receptor protein involved in Fe transport